MRRVSNILQSRTQQTAKLLFGKTVDLQNSLLLRVQANFSTFAQHDKAGYSTSAQHVPSDGSLSDRVYADYVIYKGKAALAATPILPRLINLDFGRGMKLDRRGSVLLKFTPAVGEHKYGWEKSQLFSLSAPEVGSFLSLGPNDSCEFFHDPSMKSSNAGQVRKTLSIKSHADATGYMMTLTVVNNILKSTERVSVPVTTAEFAVLRAAFSFVLPHILGWGHHISRPSRITEENQSKAPSKAEPEHAYSEWER